MEWSKWKNECFWFLAAPFCSQAWEGLSLMYLMIPVLLVHSGSAWVYAWHITLNIWSSKTVLLWDNQQSQFIVLEAKEAHWGNVLLAYIYYCILTMHREFIISWIWRLLQVGQQLQLCVTWFFSPWLKRRSVLKGQEYGLQTCGLHNHMCLSFSLWNKSNNTSYLTVLLGG